MPAKKPKGAAAAARLDEHFGDSTEAKPEVSTQVDSFDPPPGTATNGRKMRKPRRELEPWEHNPRLIRTEEAKYQKGASLKEKSQIAPLITMPHTDPEKRALGIQLIVDGVTRWEGGEAPYGDWAIYEVDYRELTFDEALEIAEGANSDVARPQALDQANYYRLKLASMGGGDESLRTLALKKGVSSSRIQQLTALFNLPGSLDPETGKGTLLYEFAQLKLGEKHGRALLMLQDDPEAQWSYFKEIERTEMSGTAAINTLIKRKKAREAAEAKKLQDAEAARVNAEKEAAELAAKAIAEAEAAGQQRLDLEQNAGGTGGNQGGNADDADFKEQDEQLGNRDHETRGQKAGTNGVGSSAPASSGVGFSTASSEGENTRGAGGSIRVKIERDNALQYLVPAADQMRDLAILVESKAELTEDEERAVLAALQPLNQAVRALKAAANRKPKGNSKQGE